jgi:hypothetical protein
MFTPNLNSFNEKFNRLSNFKRSDTANNIDSLDINYINAKKRILSIKKDSKEENSINETSSFQPVFDINQHETNERVFITRSGTIDDELYRVNSMGSETSNVSLQNTHLDKQSNNSLSPFMSRKVSWRPLSLSPFSETEDINTKDIVVPMLLCSSGSINKCNKDHCYGIHDVTYNLNRYGQLPNKIHSIEIPRLIVAHEKKIYKIYNKTREAIETNIDSFSESFKSELVEKKEIFVNNMTYELIIQKKLSVPYSIIDKLEALKDYSQYNENLSRGLLENDKAYISERTYLRQDDSKRLLRNDKYINKDNSELFNKYKQIKNYMKNLKLYKEWNKLLRKIDFNNNEIILIENILSRMNLCNYFQKGKCENIHCNNEHDENNLICYYSLDKLCNSIACKKCHIEFVQNIYENDIEEKNIYLTNEINKNNISIESVDFPILSPRNSPSFDVSRKSPSVRMMSPLFGIENQYSFTLNNKIEKILEDFDYRKITQSDHYDNLIGIYKLDEETKLFKLTNKYDINIPEGISEISNYYKTKITIWNDIIKNNIKNVTIIDDYTFSILIRSNENLDFYNKNLQNKFVSKKRNSEINTFTWTIKWANPSIQDEFNIEDWEEYNNKLVFNNQKEKTLIVNYITFTKFKIYKEYNIFMMYEHNYTKNKNNKAFPSFIKKWDTIQERWNHFIKNKTKNPYYENGMIDNYYSISDYFCGITIHNSELPFNNDVLMKEIAMKNKNLYEKYKNNIIYHNGPRVSFKVWIESDPLLSKTMNLHKIYPNVEFATIYNYVMKINRDDITLDTYINNPNQVKSWINKRNIYGNCIPDIDTYILEEENINKWINSKSILNNISYETFSCENFEAIETKLPMDLTFFSYEELINVISYIEMNCKLKLIIDNRIKISFYNYQELIEKILKNGDIQEITNECNFIIKTNIKSIIEESFINVNDLVSKLSKIYKEYQNCYDLIINNNVKRIFQSINDYDVIKIINLIKENKNSEITINKADNINTIKQILNNIESNFLSNRKSEFINSVKKYIDINDVKTQIIVKETFKEKLEKKSKKVFDVPLASLSLKDTSEKSTDLSFHDTFKDQMKEFEDIDKIKLTSKYNILIEKFQNKIVVYFKNNINCDKFKNIKKSFSSSKYDDNKIDYSKVGDDIKYIFVLGKENPDNCFIINKKIGGGSKLKRKNDNFYQDIIFLLQKISNSEIEYDNNSESSETYIPLNKMKNRFTNLENDSSDSDLSESEDEECEINVINIEKPKNINNIYSVTLHIK